MAAKPKSVFIVGFLAVALAAVASVALYNYLKGQEAKVNQAVSTTNVMVASDDIAAGSTIITTQVKTVSWPSTTLPAGTFSNSSDVVGRVALNSFAKGEPIIESKLVPKEGQTGILTYKIPEGHRAMTVGVDQVSGVAGFITPGNRVDVVLTTNQLPNLQQPVSRIVLQDVPVLAIGQIVQQEQKEGKPQIVPTVTMDVNPVDAEKLAIASTQGKLQLVLRRAGDASIVNTPGTTVTKVIGMASAGPVRVSAPKQHKMSRVRRVKRAESGYNVEVWRGDKKEISTFQGE